jgi:hypothetical protein
VHYFVPTNRCDRRVGQCLIDLGCFDDVRPVLQDPTASTAGVDGVEDSVEWQLIRSEGFDDSSRVGWCGRQDRVEFGSTFEEFFGYSVAHHHGRDFC